MGTCQRIHTPRGSALEWLHSGQELDSGRGLALFWGQRHSTVALWPSSGNNDTAEPIDISGNLDTAAATGPQWHSMVLLREHGVLVRSFLSTTWMCAAATVLCTCTLVLLLSNEGGRFTDISLFFNVSEIILLQLWLLCIYTQRQWFYCENKNMKNLSLSFKILLFIWNYYTWVI